MSNIESVKTPYNFSLDFARITLQPIEVGMKERKSFTAYMQQFMKIHEEDFLKQILALSVHHKLKRISYSRSYKLHLALGSINKIESLLIKQLDSRITEIMTQHRKSLANYFVFIDQNVPYHSDLITLGVADVDPKKYYRSINSFLERISNKFNIQAHVCCHPRADVKKLHFKRIFIFLK